MRDVMYNQGASGGVGIVHCLDAKSGTAYWTYDAWAAVWASPLIIGDHVFIADTAGTVSIFRLTADPQRAMRLANGKRSLYDISRFWLLPSQLVWLESKVLQLEVAGIHPLITFPPPVAACRGDRRWEGGNRTHRS